MRLSRGTCDAILNHPAEIVLLVAIHIGVMHADIGKATNHDQGVYFQSLKQDLKICAKEGRVAALADEMIGRPEIHFLHGQNPPSRGGGPLG